MFVITADQIGSRTDRDRAADLIADLVEDHGGAFMLPPDQTAGDEIQLILREAAPALKVVLAIHRTGRWSLGLGVGSVRLPLPAATRQASGNGFIAARDAVTRAKKTEARFALTAVGPLAPESVGALTGSDVEALLTMLLLIRQRRSAEGWEAVDLLAQGLPQVAVAGRLGVSTAAVSQRVRTSLWRVEESARPALARLLETLDRAMSETEPDA